MVLHAWNHPPTRPPPECFPVRGQHYYSHLGLRPPSKDFDYNQPLIRKGPNDYILLRNGRKKLVRSLQGCRTCQVLENFVGWEAGQCRAGTCN